MGVLKTAILWPLVWSAIVWSSRQHRNANNICYEALLEKQVPFMYCAHVSGEILHNYFNVSLFSD